MSGGTGAAQDGQRDPGYFTELDDPAFLRERARVRQLLEHEPENAIDRAQLERLHQAMTREFDRRARLAWARGS